jgi:hypothetical protein
MLAMSAERPGGGAVSPEHSGGTLLGKRYGHERVGIEVLCTKGGQGSMSFGGHALEFRASKPLPSSD